MAAKYRVSEPESGCRLVTMSELLQAEGISGGGGGEANNAHEKLVTYLGGGGGDKLSKYRL